MARSRFAPPSVEEWAMRERFPTFRYDRRRQLWRGSIQPRPDGMTFEVEIDPSYVAPRARILSPKLETMPGSSLPPHHYADGSVCLFHPRDEGWDATRPMASTIVPWLHEWCFYYECWLRTGEWYGPEYLHEEPKPEALRR